MELPTFKYHPDPLKTGSVVPSETQCACCGVSRGLIYVGPIYSKHDGLDERICPWCIADGSAAARFDADFTDADGVGDDGAWGKVAPEIVDEVARRTPGFSGWQQERWQICCQDACEFLGPAGAKELTHAWAGAAPSILRESDLTGPEAEEYLHALDANGSPTAYVFRCRHCKKLSGYSDCD